MVTHDAPHYIHLYRPVPEPKFEIQLPTKLMRIHLDISCDGTIFKDKVIWNFNGKFNRFPFIP